MRVVGIDPGRDGGMADLVREAGGFRVLRVVDTPFYGEGTKAEPDVSRAVSWITAGGPPALVMIEQIGFMPTDRFQIFSAMRLMRYFGEIVGGVKGAHLPLKTVRPADWQKRVLGSPEKGGTKEGRRKRVKSKSIAECRKLYPAFDLVPPNCKNPHDGWSDAILIAHYGLLHVCGGQV